MENFNKYTKNYFLPPNVTMDWAKKEYINAPPIWCSVDLRDGNQSLIVPMSLDEKISFFQMLVKVGFKEIEVGFPAASETEYIFLRTLIERNLIPEDVTIQVLTQSREHIIKKTFEALNGVKKAIVHLYNSTSVAQREQVFKMDKSEIKEIAVSGAKLVQEFSSQYAGNYSFEYSPESFTGTEIDFALEICNAVIDIWKPSKEKKIIINLPATVSVSMPHIFAAQIEYMSRNLSNRENIILSLHSHNDRGSAVVESEMGLLAGAERIEGTLFGNGERTGNADIVTIAMNMFSQGVDPQLNFSNLPDITDFYEDVTHMRVYERQPYSGQLVFAAFSGSHQDAIAKGMKFREQHPAEKWCVPYLPIDPKDVGREYDSDVIRINSQSGKGGIGFILEQKFGFDLPKKMREDFGYFIKNVSDQQHKELLAEDIYDIFKRNYINIFTRIKLLEAHYIQRNGIEATITIEIDSVTKVITKNGNGRLDAVFNALKDYIGVDYTISTYKEHALTTGSSSEAVAYVGIEDKSGKISWGAGIDNDIMLASVYALVSALNRELS